jgi:D-alanyl-D-alanine carboxypeptidase
MKIYLLTAALCVVVALILAITLPQLGLVGKKPQETVSPSPTPSVSEGSPTVSETPTPSSPESETPTPSEEPDPAIERKPMTAADLTATNPLLIVNAEHPFNPAKALNIVNMYNVKDTSHGVNRLQFAGSTALLNEEAFLALQELQFVMGDAHEGYCLFTKTCQITVGENMVDCDCSEKTLDDATKSPHSTGYVVDLRLYKKTDGNTSYSYFQSPGVQDVAATVLKNCAKFGWIQSWSATNLAANGKTANDQGEFRYVGVPHALYIMEKGLTFDGYMEAVRQTNYMKPLQVIDAESQTVYKIYFVSAEDATNPAKGVPVPAGSDYKIQGNGVDGFIVTLTEKTAE